MAINPVFTRVSEEIIKQKKKEKEEDLWQQNPHVPRPSSSWNHALKPA